MSPSVVSLVSRLAVSMRTCRFASRDAKAWPRPGLMQRVPGGRRPAQDHQHHKVLDEDIAVEEVEDKLDALLSQEKKRKAAVKMSRIKRQMTPPGAPERTLSWDTIEQIRYLRRERPEEWTLERLAGGFSVPHDDILRVLKSKFSPTGPRKVKQDAKVMARLGQRTAQLPAGGVPQSKLLLPAQKTPTMLVAVDDASGPGTLVRSAHRMLTPRVVVGRGGGEISGTHPVTGPASLVTRPNLLPISTATVEVSRPTPATSISEEDDCGAPPVESGEDDVDEERWDGEVLTESELEELMLTTKPSAAVQVGKDFYDPEGNFLYRI
ncbi:Neugrin [Merluccius polli]|uniref:Neugrin n=1 Tax=Merluccius polli TaxID=89951 RepID=A0AA47P1C1_MERPO|nr:Neugrin [Merluccius polli]